MYIKINDFNLDVLKTSMFEESNIHFQIIEMFKFFIENKNTLIGSRFRDIPLYITYDNNKYPHTINHLCIYLTSLNGNIKGYKYSKYSFIFYIINGINGTRFEYVNVEITGLNSQLNFYCWQKENIVKFSKNYDDIFHDSKTHPIKVNFNDSDDFEDFAIKVIENSEFI